MDADVAVVGGGIAGSALAYVAASAGLRVVVLERQTAYRDKVRGEYMHPWGVAEAVRLGVLDTLLGCGGSFVTEIMGYDENIAPGDVTPLPLARLRPDVPGAVNVGHPQACAALAEIASQAGAVFLRGVGEVSVSPGGRPAIRFELDDVEHELTCRIVVAADGRASSVRRQLGLVLHHTEVRTWGAGMLACDLDAVPVHQSFGGTEGDTHYFVFPRPGGVARLYHFFAYDQTDRFAGPDRQQEFLDAFRMECLPLGEAIAASTPAGPCAKYPMDDTWVDEVAVPGVVLVGDAAGYSDAILGEGLSIAMRDARAVADVLTGSEDWSPAAFAAYAEERAERMRRLRVVAHLDTALRCTFTPEGRARRAAFFAASSSDPALLQSLAIPAFAGPEIPPAEAFSDSAVQRILSLR